MIYLNADSAASRNFHGAGMRKEQVGTMTYKRDIGAASAIPCESTAGRSAHSRCGAVIAFPMDRIRPGQPKLGKTAGAVLSHLENENSALRRRAVRLALEIQELVESRLG